MKRTHIFELNLWGNYFSKKNGKIIFKNPIDFKVFNLGAETTLNIVMRKH